MASFLRKLWRRFAIPMDVVRYEVPDLDRIGATAIANVLYTIPYISTLEIDQNPGQVVFTFDSTVVHEKTIRTILNYAGIEVIVVELNYANRD